MTTEKPQLLIITGMSGAGKSQVINSLEDVGFFCIDNLPASLLMKFVEGIMQPQSSIKQAAIVIDVRGGDFFAELEKPLERIRHLADCQVIFLEASDETLIRRYKETRRKHPLADRSTSISQSIAKEREMLQEIRGHADLIIDTSSISVHQLNQEIVELFTKDASEAMKVSLLSFGYKYGLPIEADLVMDVRFLPNPYYEESLRPLCGLDKPIQDFVFSYPVTVEFVNRYISLLRYLLPHYRQEGKRHLTIAIGCTGGRHRSVAIAEAIYERLYAFGYYPSVHHRDINRSNKTV